MKQIWFLLVYVLFVACSTGANKSNNQSNYAVQSNSKIDTTPRVIGVGGIFFKSKNTDSTKHWYDKNLGINFGKYGSTFEFRNANDPNQINYLQWSPFSAKTKYFLPSEKEFMINYRVNNLEALYRKFKENGVQIVDSIETVDYGKFLHIMDNDGNKIELWEAVDSVLTKIGTQTIK